MKGHLSSYTEPVVVASPSVKPLYRHKAVHLTTVHSPGDVRIFLKECRTLAHAGYEVALIARGNKTEVNENVKICGLNINASYRWDRMSRGLWKMLVSALAERGDLYHFHDPELIPVGLFLKLIGKKVVYDVHEDFRASLLESDREWLPPFLKWLTSQLIRVAEKIGTSIYDATVAATPNIGALFPENRTVVVQNYPLRDELMFDAQEQYSLRPRNIVFAGGISERRGIREMIKIMSALGEFDEASLLLAGEFSPPELRGEVQNLPGWNHVKYLGLLSREDLRRYLGSARIGLVLFHPIRNHIEAQPNKLFEYMSAGIPVVASDFPLWRKIVQEARAGLLVDPMDVEEAAAAVKWLLGNPDKAEQMGRNGAKAVQECLNWDGEGEKLVFLYRKLLTK